MRAEHGEQIMENMGIRMMKARFKNNLTIKEAVEKLGISPSTYSNYEQGKSKIPVKKLIEICLIYNVSADYILGFERTEQ